MCTPLMKFVHSCNSNEGVTIHLFYQIYVSLVIYIMTFDHAAIRMVEMLLWFKYLMAKLN